MELKQGSRGVEVLEQIGKGGDAKSPLGCMQCGLCAASCPLGEFMEFPPRKLILQINAGNLDKVLASPSLWMCVGCYLCSHRCPRDIELTDGLWPALRDRAMQQGFQPPAELQETFQNIFKYGNALGKSPRQRLDWAKDLEVRRPGPLARSRGRSKSCGWWAAIPRTILATTSSPGPSPAS